MDEPFVVMLATLVVPEKKLTRFPVLLVLQISRGVPADLVHWTESPLLAVNPAVCLFSEASFFVVKSPFSKLKDWKKFYNFHLKNKGDDFYAMMSPVYSEGIMRKLGFEKKYKKVCNVTEQIQPRAMLFKTNYRSINEAKKYVNILEKNLEIFFNRKN